MDLSSYTSLLPESYINKAQDVENTQNRILESLLYHVSNKIALKQIYQIL